ncbi:NlpC/P60 family protein [Streptomyces sp. MRC013]|uniref:C40 family peptidase n=1 Tax=Streptomyces sp. MRC013 TaxID=2898276 RepID=UPI002025E234|nr:NlpC/P60 family protein [Streptomyces sp. MRC013]URM89629.1 NlpC/P60 family protein [Streptomyces sp. MRC013]
MTFRRGAAVLALASSLVLGAPAPPAGAEGESVSELLTRLQRLYREAEAAGETYEAAGEELAAQAAAARRLGGDLARTRDALTEARDAAGRLARAQYRGRGEPPPALRLLFTGDPEHALDHALDQTLLLRRLARERAAAVARLEGGERRAGAVAAAARRALDRTRALAAARQRVRDGALAGLRETEEALAGLGPERLAELAALELGRADPARSGPPAPGAPDAEGAPSAEGAEAVAYAAGLLGEAYPEAPGVPGDSGLTARAWAAAGRTLPSTGGEQWRTLPKVPLGSLRPGDLVVYFPEATHVALYAGGGRVLHVPRPGAAVAVAPLTVHPVLGAVRPDAGAPPLASYAPPDLGGGGA